MTPEPHVTAVLVTYNRSELLVRCLAALAGQTRRPDRVLLVDNASTDGTPQVIATFLEDEPFRDVEVLRQAENTGGAGGFATGMREALARGTDWVWVMDDDVAPAPDCLEVLLTLTPGSELVQPQRIGADGDPSWWEPTFSAATGTVTQLDNRSFRNGKEVTYTNVACFEGALISRRIVELVGTPDPAYFIIGDDTLFGLKASVHTNIAIARDARMQRLLAMGDLAPWKSYYSTRNAFMVRTDACAYLGIEPTRLQDVVFAVNIGLESLVRMRSDRASVRPILRGLRDGIGYARRHRSPTLPARGGR